MPKYCTNCGKKLEKEEHCSCLEKHSITLIDEICSFIKTPLDVLEKESKKENAFLLCLLTSLSFGLTSFIPRLTMFSLYYSCIDIIRITVFTFVFFLGFSLVIQLLENTCFKGNLTFEHVYGIISKSSISLLIFNIGSFLLAFISAKISVWLFLFGGLLFVLCNFYGMLKQSTIDKNKIPYLYGLSILTTIIIGILLLFII